MPFWRGEAARRTAELGEAVGALTRELADRRGRPDDPRLARGPSTASTSPRPASLRDHVARQVRAAGAAPDDRTVLVETFRDPAGELGLAVLTPFGGQLHHALKLALQGQLAAAAGHRRRPPSRRRRPPDPPAGDRRPAARPLRGPDRRTRRAFDPRELGESALFGLRFRQNAGRALLMPRPDPSKRTPFWLQRLRRQGPAPGRPAGARLPDRRRDLPRMPRGRPRPAPAPDRSSTRSRIGTIRVVDARGEAPSPFASGLIFTFTRAFLYEWDEPRRPDRPDRPPEVTDGMLDPLLDPGSYARWLDPDAVGRVEGRLRGVGRPPRTVDEMAEWLRHLGDLAPSELCGPMSGFLHELREQGRASTMDLPGTDEPGRWVVAEELPMYAAAFGLADRAGREPVGIGGTSPCLDPPSLPAHPGVGDRGGSGEAVSGRACRRGRVA